MTTRANRCAIVALALLAGAAMVVSCAHAPPGHSHEINLAPLADSATIALWRMDDPGFEIKDQGPLHLDARAGNDTKSSFGRFHAARVFSRSIDSFVYAPYVPALESSKAITVEAWVEPAAFSTQELSLIACRWTEQPNERSWLFGIVGQKLGIRNPSFPTPGYHQTLVQLGTPSHLVFALQPAEAGLPVSYFSTSAIELERWTHVAATYDGREVRFYVNGRLDAQYANDGAIRTSRAPVLIGNYFDPRWLSDYGDRLSVGNAIDRTPYYAYEGSIDELRISAAARTDFVVGR